MKGLFKKLNADKIIRLSTYSSFGLLLVHIIYVLIVYSSLPPLLPLFNQMPWGGDRLGDKMEIFIPFLLAFSIIVFNLFLSLYFYGKMPLVSRILSFTGLLICILTIIFVIRTVQLII